MEIRFTQIYPEVGASFGLPSELLRLLQHRLNKLGHSIAKFKAKYGAEDFVVIFIISATTRNDALVVNGPSYQRKHNKVEFVLHIPFQSFDLLAEQAPYVLGHIGAGIKVVFEKYGEDVEGIDQVIDEVTAEVLRDPSALGGPLAGWGRN